MLLGTIAFACFFVLISANKVNEPVNTDCTESGTKNENSHSQEEYILENFIGSVLIGIK